MIHSTTTERPWNCSVSTELLVSSHGNQIRTHQIPSTTRYSSNKHGGIITNLLPRKCNQLTYHIATKNCLLWLISFHSVCQSSVPWMEDGHCRTTCRLDHKPIFGMAIDVHNTVSNCTPQHNRPASH